MKSLVKNRNFLTRLSLLGLGLSLCACAATPSVAHDSYAMDIYRYHLSESEFARLKYNMSTRHNYTLDNQTSINILSGDAYWKMIKQIESDIFYSTYHYEYVECKRHESSEPFINYTTKQPCSYKYAESETQVNLRLLNYTTKEIQFNLQVQSGSSLAESQTFSFDNAKQFMLFYIPESDSIQVFILNQNLINLPWTYFNKTPQADNELRKIN